MAKRIKLILLFPVFVIIFMLGWALYVVGDRRGRSNFEPLEQKKRRDLEEQCFNDSEIEMGLVDEVLEDNTAD